MPTDKERGVWKWLEIEKGKRWETPLVPDGDICVARVQRSFSKDPVKKEYVYYGYRSAQVWGRRPTPEEAMKLLQSGKSERDKKDAVAIYVEQNAGDLPAFLALTEKERAAVRAQYSFAAPRVGVPKRATPAPVGAGVAAVDIPAPKGAGKPRAEGYPPEATMARGKEGNPKAAGTDSHKRWVRMLKHADKGSTVGAFLKDGGNQSTLRNGVKKGYVKIGD